MKPLLAVAACVLWLTAPAIMQSLPVPNSQPNPYDRGQTWGQRPAGRPYGNTSAVHVECGGRRVARERDARWCLDYLDRLAAFVAEHGRFSAHSQHADFVTVVTQARGYYTEVLGTAVG